MKQVIKKSKTMGDLIIKPVDYNIAKKMIIENHYSGKWNSAFGKLNFGIFRDDVLLGVAVYGNLMNPKSIKSITDDGDVIELNRLWLDDVLGHNAETLFLSATFKLIKHNHPEIVAIQSFADGRLGVGTIYKAANFKYYGFSESLFFDNGHEVFHKVPLENTKRPKGFMLNNLYVITKSVETFYVNTYRYIYTLQKNAHIKLEEKPYPEYQKGVRYVDFVPAIGTYARLSLMYKMFSLHDLSSLCLLYLKEYYDYSQIEEELEKQSKNKSLELINKDYSGKEALSLIIRAEYEKMIENGQND